MRRLFLLLSAAFCIGTIVAQSPDLFNYQAVMRSTDGQVISEQNVSVQISILQNTSTVYKETFSTWTSKFGHINIKIGNGAPQEGDFSLIDWSAGPYFLKVELDENGGSEYREMSSSELLSVPYALHAKTAANAFSGNYDDLANVPAVTSTDSSFTVKLSQADEDYIDFGTMEGFTNNSDWSVIEIVRMPEGMGSETGWHFFRGKGWVDLEGDIAIQLAPNQVHAWCRSGGWMSLTKEDSFEEGRWYTICFQHDASENTLSLYIDGEEVAQRTDVPPMDDAANTDKLFWGGQDVDPARGHGDLYSECSIEFAYQDWYQRLLSIDEIRNYDGVNKPSDALFFSAKIGLNNVTDASGNGHNGTNGNTPEYIGEFHTHSDFSEDLFVDGNLTVTGDLKVGGNLEIEGEIIGSVNIDTIHFSQISGLLGQGQSAIFPQVLDNTCTLELEGVGTYPVVVVGSIGTETERISEFAGVYNGVTRYRENAGLTMEFPLLVETLEDTDRDEIIPWFEETNPVSRNMSVIIKDAAGTETGRWILLYYLPGGYTTGNDGRTRFTFVPSTGPDNLNYCEYQNDFGQMSSYNPATDTLFEISNIFCGDHFFPAVETNFEERTITITMDYNEGYKVYDWMKTIISGINDRRPLSIIHTVNGDPNNQITRFNHYECVPIKYEHIYGFGLNTKLKARLVIAYGFREESQ